LVFAMVLVPASGQAQSAASKAISAQLSAPAKGYLQPKTEWGDPDISGVWTSDAALGIPRERPEKFADRAFLNDQEFTDAQKADAQRVNSSVNAIGSFRNDGGWKNKSYRQTSLVIEPADGRTPAFTAEAMKRAAPRDRGSFGEGPFDTPLDFTLYDRCITRGIVGSVMPVVYGNGNRIVQAPGMVVISYEMVHDTRDHLHGRTAASGIGSPAVAGRFARTLGRQHAGRRDHELHRPDQHRGRERQRPAPQHADEAGRAHQPHRQGRTALRGACGRSQDLRHALHALAAVDIAARVRAAALRVPRGQLHAAALAQRRAEEDAAIEADRKKGITRKRKSIQQNLDAGANPIPGRANPNDEQ
jgi:hypothetical protein